MLITNSIAMLNFSTRFFNGIKNKWVINRCWVEQDERADADDDERADAGAGADVDIWLWFLDLRREPLALRPHRPW
jgi:hypothetical protein